MIKIAVIVIAVLALWVLGLGQIAQDRIWEIVSFLIALAAMFALLFGWNWIRAPGRMDQENADQIATLESKLAIDRRRIAIKDKLGAALREGTAIMMECKKEGIARGDLESRANKWYRELQDFVTDSFGEGETSYLQHGSGTIVWSASKQPNEDLRSSMDHILQRLTRILQSADTKPIRDDFSNMKG